MDQSTCGTCAKTKPVREFYLKRGKPGSECRSCVQVRSKGLRPAGETKFCTGCERDLSRESFYLRPAHYTGLSFYCKACYAAKTAEARKADPDYKQNRRDYYQANREKLSEYSRARYRRDPVRHKLSWWRSQGIDITEDGYYDLHSRQGGCCAICNKSEHENGKALAVDHDHDTGQVRGLLCDDCNIALGRFKDSPNALRRAIEYLEAN